MAYIVSISIADAAVRDGNSISRNSQSSGTTIQRKQQTNSSRTTAKRVAARTPSVTRVVHTASTRPANAPISSRAATATRTNKTVTRTPTKGNTRNAINTVKSARTATQNTISSNTFGTGYNACRDAYFTCMDQFCATQNDTYRRCVCSSRLEQIKSRENLLSQTANQLQDFKDFNLSVIDKSAAEVSAMISATSGEVMASYSKDDSESAKQLASISSVLSKAKSQSLSTSGTLDIGGDIKQIWNTTSIADGANIANLTGESLYNAVHAQCSQMVAQTCESKSILNMVVSAYGMYIENDCTTLSNSLDSKTIAAKGTVRDTEREMHAARLDNYNAHNSTSINDCVANVRTDLTADTACGSDYVHCLDITGRYLNRETGEPIYSENFYQLDGQISLSGNILTNQTNRLIVAELNRMRPFAQTSLDTCRDLADDVWDEFVRQAITEIYQGQQERIRTVKNECFDVVNACYDEQNQSLKDFSNIKEQLLLGQRLELSEELCREKLDACSNLYGQGPDGLKELITAMKDLTNAKIANQCRVTLEEYAHNICAVPNNDTLHSYPYACRVYTPGTQKYAQSYACNQQLWSTTSSSDYVPLLPEDNETTSNLPTLEEYTCPTLLKYQSCKSGYFMTSNASTHSLKYDGTPVAGNDCTTCPANYTCAGGTSEPKLIQTDTPIQTDVNTTDCGDYPGSMYQRLVRYALQSCVRPSDANDKNYSISIEVLQDVNTVMDSIRVEMGHALATECERLGGTWVDTAWVDENTDNNHDITGDQVYKKFYDETGANKSWGYCALILGGGTIEEKKETLSEICSKLGGTWQEIAWIDQTKNTTCCAAGVCATGDGSAGEDGCHDYNGDILLTSFYSETMADTKAGYCAKPSH